MDEGIKKILWWVFENVLLVLFIIFFLSLIGVEFNDYPHQKIKIIGNSNLTIWDKHLFCPRWVDEGYSSKLTQIDFSFYSSSNNSCLSGSNVWTNPEENRVTYYLGYEIILSDVRDYNKEIEIEVVDKGNRAFLLYQGNRIL